MCGRYVTVTKLKEIEKRFNVVVDEPDKYVINTNISPGQYAPVITNNKTETVEFFRFGLTPSWSKKLYMTINARAEGDNNKENDLNYKGGKGIINKPSFRKPIRSQRCLVIADAFYEGPEKEKLSKPYLVYLRNYKRPFAFAGIWDTWTNPTTYETTNSFAIITTSGNKLMQAIGHPRMPVILPNEYEKDWISNDLSLSEVTSLLEPFPENYMNAYPVSPRMKKPQVNDFELLKPIGQRVFKEYEYELYDELVLEGMGNTRARQRKSIEGRQTKMF